MEDIIKQALKNIAEDHQIHIIYACEAGSRAWGIESQDSDYDVRFIYVRSQAAYLALDTPRDVIELPIIGDLDINGWDIYKALRLLRKSNPSLLEWLFSPLIYQESSPAIETMRHIARSSIAPQINLHYHYEHMASGNYQQYIQGKATVLIKKYLYVLRPLIMLLYLDQHGEMPFTINFPTVLADVTITEDIRTRINDLIVRKQAGDELGMGPSDNALNAFIDASLKHWQEQTFSDTHDHQALHQETSKILQSILNAESLLSTQQQP